jgi:osmoprotectant transport system ATP-binding protein
MHEPSAPPIEIQFQAVELSRGGSKILRGIELAVRTGETLVLVGRSGSGKSTVLKLVNRMLSPDRGRVVVRGKATADWDPIQLRRQIGYVVQEVGLFPHMTVQRNVDLVPRLLGWEPERIAARAAEVLALVGLDPAAHAQRYPHQLSGGQRQRVGVSRAVAADPPLLLMDEPFGALDPVTRSEIHDEFRTIQRQLRKTIVLVTHDMAEAFLLATRIAVIEEGRLIAVDTPRAIAASTHPGVQALLRPLFEISATMPQGKAEG